MRTNVVLDEDLVERAQQLTGIKTTRVLIEEALRLIPRREQGEIRARRGQLHREGNSEAFGAVPGAAGVPPA